MNRIDAAATRQRVNASDIPDDDRVNLDEFQTAKLLGLSVHWLRRMRWAGGGIPFVKIGNLCRYRRSDIDTYLSGKVCTSTSSFAPGSRKPSSITGRG